MFDTLFKKKIREEQLADYFVKSLINMVENGFPEVADLINTDPTFIVGPDVHPTDNDKFLLILLAGNLNYIPKYFNDYQDIRLIDKILKIASRDLGVTYEELKRAVSQYQAFFKKVNHPSKNTQYAMSKALFFKYNLNECQEDYFKNMETPNPIFLKHLDDLLVNFIWDWKHFVDKFKIIQ